MRADNVIRGRELVSSPFRMRCAGPAAPISDRALSPRRSDMVAEPKVAGGQLLTRLGVDNATAVAGQGRIEPFPNLSLVLFDQGMCCRELRGFGIN